MSKEIYTVTKRMEIAGSHRLELPYESKCSNTHGHNWIVTVTCTSEALTEYGMVIDFTDLKGLIHNRLDHAHINDILPFNPTAENMARWISVETNAHFALLHHKGEMKHLAYCSKVEVQESEGNIAIYEVIK